MLKKYYWNNVSDAEILLKRPQQDRQEAFQLQVKDIINQVKLAGDQAIQSLTLQFDQVNLTKLQVSPDEITEAWDQTSEQIKSALISAKNQITLYHQMQKSGDFIIETLPGIICESRVVPIERVGLYIPGGTSPLISTVFMLGVPAEIANCPLRILCTPPNRAGKVNPAILVAATLCGIERIYKVGGAQAIAAMAYGTETIPKMDKITGPGNQWVTTAKKLVSVDPNGASIEMPAGPSEVLVIADDNANPQFVAADLLAQAEHGVDSQVILICLSDMFAEKVNQSINTQIENLSRKQFIMKALEYSRCIIVDDIQQAIAISNRYAPEHLMLQIENAREYVNQITAAGSIFLGAWSPETAGDYASGTNHVLPTSGYARSLNGVSVRDFLKTISVQELTPAGLNAIAEPLQVLTQLEGLDAHWNAAKIRLEVMRSLK